MRPFTKPAPVSIHVGPEIMIGGRPYVVPVLRAALHVRLEQDGVIDQALARGVKPEHADQVSAGCKIIHAALRQRYPDIALADIEELGFFDYRRCICSALGIPSAPKEPS